MNLQENSLSTSAAEAPDDCRIEGLADARLCVFQAFSDGLTPPPPIDFTRWAQENISFGSDSPFPGPYNPDRFPFFREILSCLQPDHPCREVILQGSAQIGKTVVAQVFVGCSLDLDPGPFMYVHPSIDNARRWDDAKWAPFVRNSPALSRIFPAERSRDRKNRSTFKERMDGAGFLELRGANSPSGLSMSSYPRQIQDDLSKWENNEAGDPEGQADKRSQAFEWAKILKISTPHVEGACRISQAYKRSDQRRFLVPCPHCGFEHPLEWENFKKSLIDGMSFSDAHFSCPDCGGIIEHHHKEDMVARGHWVASNPGSTVPGFLIWSAYSCLISWARIAKEYFKAKDDPEKEQVFINDTVGLAYEQRGEAPPWKEIHERSQASAYHAGRIPEGALILSMGLDCQGDRVEWLLKGFGADLRRWTIQQGVIEGHISEDRTRAALDALVMRTWRNGAGRSLRADILAIDANYDTDTVHDWAKRFPEQRVIMVRGVRGDHAVPMVPVRWDRKANGKARKNNKRFWNIGVSGLKSTLFKNLEKSDPLARGYCGFPCDLGEEYFRQLCSERRILKHLKTGFSQFEWVKLPGVRNEVLDMEIYAEAGARRLRWHEMSESEWERLRGEREVPPPDQQLDLLEAMISGPVAAIPAAAVPKPFQRVRSRGIGPL